MSDTVRSVFRQKKYEKVAYLAYDRVVYDENFIGEETIGVYNILNPTLNINQQIFLEDVQKVVTIKSKMQSTDGSTVYYINDKIVDTDNTRRTIAECRQELLDLRKEQYDSLKEKYECLKKEYEYLKQEYNSLKYAYDWHSSVYKYEHRFFNFKR